MALCRMSNSQIQSLFIVFIVFLSKISSNLDSQHQIIKADLGQTVTLSCLFDQEKIDQVC